MHLVGKDILTTHSVYWPTLLMGVGLPVPKQILAHGWWVVGETKMSKSLGNVVDPLALRDDFGTDAVRSACHDQSFHMAHAANPTG